MFKKYVRNQLMDTGGAQDAGQILPYSTQSVFYSTKIVMDTVGRKIMSAPKLFFPQNKGKQFFFLVV